MKLDYETIKNELVKFRKQNNLSNVFIDHKNKKIDINWLERFEQYDIIKFLPKNSIVLELGARFGTVSCIINRKIANSLHQVSVEPDERVWNALEYNKKNNKCDFNIFKGVISERKKKLSKINDTDGYGTVTIDSDDLTLEQSLNVISFTELEKKYNLKFNVLVADCEGCLGELLKDNPHLYTQLKMIFYEKDNPKQTNYNEIERNLVKHGFKPIKKNFHSIFTKY